jgi:hypothetical protein
MEVRNPNKIELTDAYRGPSDQTHAILFDLLKEIFPEYLVNQYTKDSWEIIDNNVGTWAGGWVADIHYINGRMQLNARRGKEDGRWVAGFKRTLYPALEDPDIASIIRNHIGI